MCKKKRTVRMQDAQEENGQAVTKSLNHLPAYDSILPSNV